MTTDIFSQQAASQATEQTLQQAIALHQVGQLQEAGEIYRNILQDFPNHPEANHNMGVLAVQMKLPASGLPYFMAALEADPKCRQYWLSYIDALFQAGNLNNALEVMAIARQQGLQGDDADALAALMAGGEGLQRHKNNPIKSGKSAKKPAQHRHPGNQEINALVSLFNQGLYKEAAAFAQSMTTHFPLYGFGWKVLGAAYKQMGRSADALAPMQKAVALSPDDVDAHANFGAALQDLGRLGEAEASLRHALQIDPENVRALNNLGVTLQAMGRLEESETVILRALKIRPDFAEAYNNLGNTLKGLGRLDGAEAAYRRAQQIMPNFVDAYFNLGVLLQDMGRLIDAEASYRHALQIKPDFAVAHNNLGSTLKDMGRFEEAEASYLRALQIDPDYADGHNNLGILQMSMGRLSEAETSCRRAIEIKPDFAVAHNNLGVALQDMGKLDEAEACFRRAIKIKRDSVEAYDSMAGQLVGQGRLDESEASHRRTLEIKPEQADAQGNLLFVLNYHPDLSAEEIFSAYREYDEVRGIPLRSTWRKHGNDRNPDRRLKLGYVSPDFKHHSCRHFLEPLLAHHDKAQVELYAYAELVKEDYMTARYKSYVEHWIPTSGMSNKTLAERIRSDGIDILVELAGHTAGNRLLVFARKPAPVSASWLGYGYTTGLGAIDYYLSDEACAPVGSDGIFAETPWRIATPAYVYRPSADMGEVNSLPALNAGHITFGTLTRAIRINYKTIRVWAKILKAVPNSRLVINSHTFRDAAMQERLAVQFAEQGVTRDHLEIGFDSPPWDILRGIDIGLDCFPHNSGTTLFETLYMGVPYITLAGRPSVGRLGSSILQGIGRPEWIAVSEGDYVAKATELAADIIRLSEIRTTLRRQMQSSPLRDEQGFARKVEQAYRSMWKIWCETGDET